MKGKWNVKDLRNEAKSQIDKLIASYSSTRRVFFCENSPVVILEKMSAGGRIPRYVLVKDREILTELPVIDRAEKTIQDVLFSTATEMAEAYMKESEESGGR